MRHGVFMVRRIGSALKRHGLSGLGPLIGKNLSHYAKELGSGRLFRASSLGASEYDRIRGTDTEAVREVGSLDIQSENARHAVRYQPSPADFTAKIISRLPIRPELFTFVDYGAGKGRVVMLAAEQPFRAVIGVEFSHELCEVANSNLQKLPAEAVRAGGVECVRADAALYVPPPTPLVCYFYNPFGPSVLKAVVDRLAASLRQQPREVFIIYVHPEHRDVIESTELWTVGEASDFHVVYYPRARCAS